MGDMSKLEHIEEMALAALRNYEMSCEWAKAYDAAKEEGLESGITPSKGMIHEALKMAKLSWHGISIATKKEIAS